MRRVLTTALAIAIMSTAVPQFASGQAINLTADAVAAAIQTGTKAKGKEQGLVLRDSMQSFNAALGATNGNATASSGFSVVLYTPTTWVQKQASDAAKRYQQFKVGDVGDELLEPVLRVIANPDVPNTVTKAGMRGTSSVDHVVLQDKDRKITIQPTFKEPFDIEAANAVGGRAAFKGLNLKFPLDAVRELRGPKADRDFYIVVIGSSGEEKKFEVKKKHFEELP
jgi:hypothetical protein